MKNLKNALLLKQLYQLRQLGYKYTSATVYKEDEPDLSLPDTLEKLKVQAQQCHLCELSKSRSSVVFGEGSPQADIMFIGEAPGVTEDSMGKPFTGRSGELLTKMIENVLLIKREEVYITNIVKCRPPDNRVPTPTEAHTCYSFLLKQIELVKPKLIVTLGGTAYHYMTGDETGISKIRGTLHQQNGYTLIPTYHPSFLLRNPSAKKEVFEDLKKVKALMEQF
ncbi:uracil-DNA glycosylase [Sulfurovum sp. ST-21]|uniref:Type-4 uracil-DNA glycosylase n=1 Tax=Sulfurovum indicum TaxID=2779528 RepID=A0A7M1S6B7_9BACT|nr:uracil-DNA glycosylase [Sulfurovum indicum]QOR62886.1 uracil-DNA glycosylase [Sulfurovum indicum]